MTKDMVLLKHLVSGSKHLMRYIHEIDKIWYVQCRTNQNKTGSFSLYSLSFSTWDKEKNWKPRRGVLGRKKQRKNSRKC